LHIVESLEELKDDEFPMDGREGFFNFPLLLDEKIQTRRDIVHDHAQITLLIYVSAYSLNKLKEVFTHPYYIAVFNTRYYAQLSVLVSSVL
jgi:hypothetical protein